MLSGFELYPRWVPLFHFDLVCMMNLLLPSNQARKQHRDKTFHFAFVE